jgi:hypothetical protein
MEKTSAPGAAFCHWTPWWVSFLESLSPLDFYGTAGTFCENCTENKCSFSSWTPLGFWPPESCYDLLATPHGTFLLGNISPMLRSLLVHSDKPYFSYLPPAISSVSLSQHSKTIYVTKQESWIHPNCIVTLTISLLQEISTTENM